jgi:hypothetical protein
MGWRWQKRLKIGGGLQTTISPSGAGWSWGFRYFRYGISPNGQKWFSVGVPGTGLRYFTYLDRKTSPEAATVDTSERESIETSKSDDDSVVDTKKGFRWRNIR